MAIPIVKVIAAAKLALSKLYETAPYATPKTKPSGILCSVIEENNIIDLLNLLIDFLPFFSNIFSPLSPMYNKTPPPINPVNTTNQVTSFKSFAISIAGFNKEKKDAANIIPADRANIASKILLLTDLKKNTKLEPKTVIRNVKTPANKA